jgi:hypothetical protein
MSADPQTGDTSLEEVFLVWNGKLIEELYVHPDVQCDRCYQV